MTPRVLLHVRINEEPSHGVLEEAAHAAAHLWPGASVVPSGTAWFDDYNQHLGDFERWTAWCGGGVVYGGAPSFVGALVTSPVVGAGTGAVVAAMFAAGRPTYLLTPGGWRRILGGAPGMGPRADWTLTVEAA